MLLKSTIQEVYFTQKEYLKNCNTGLERKLLNEIRLDTNFVIIITGIRRSGKSTLLKQIVSNRIKNTCFLNFEDPRLAAFELDDFIKLDEIFSDEPKDSYYIFDEIQNVPQWEKFVRNKQDYGEKIIITGSNASLLSKELGTRLTGRHLDYELFPFSYDEFLLMDNSEKNIETFTSYLKKGGFPEYLKFEEQEILFRLTDDIIYRDIVSRYGIKNHKLLKQLLIYLITNSGKLFSYNKLKALFSTGSSNTIIDYISFFEDSYLLFTVPKFSYSLKKQIYNPRKVYSIDTGLVNVVSLSFTEDIGRRFENLIYIYLRKKYKQIYYYAEQKECDFLIMENGEITMAIQVCYKLDQDNLDRELNGLWEAMRTTNLKEGIIVTSNQEDQFKNGNMNVSVIPALKFIT